MEDILQYTIWLPVVLVIGACIGSFLNVVVYRVPLGLSVNEPRRSFCPRCGAEIPWFRNIPVLTWILQRGRCASCGGRIALRYVVVEVLTAVLFAAAWYVAVTASPSPHLIGAGLTMVFVVVLLSISFIDAEHMLIPVVFCWWGMGVGVVGNAVDPFLATLQEGASGLPWWGGLARSLAGLALGWGLLEAVVLAGKKFLGERHERFPEPVDWRLEEPEEDEEEGELAFVIDEESLGWSDLFYRKGDRIQIEGDEVHVDGECVRASSLTIYRDHVLIGSTRHSIADLRSLSGKAGKVVIPREAMGGGDPPLLGMIGAFLGWKGVIFTLFTASVYALAAAVLGRIGFGRPLPFGPFMALAALTWVFGGWQLWDWYFRTIGGF